MCAFDEYWSVIAGKECGVYCELICTLGSVVYCLEL